MFKYHKKDVIYVLAICGIGAFGLTARGAEADSTVAVRDSGVQSLYNREDVARQNVADSARKKALEANLLYSEGEYEKAIAAYLEAIKILRTFDTPEFQRWTKDCQAQIERSYYYMAQDAIALADERVQVQDFEEAIRLTRQAEKYYPEGKAEFAKKIKYLETRLAAAKVRAETGAAALLPEKGSQDYRIQVLLKQGLEFSRVGAYQKATRKFQDVLMIDPFNAIALQNLHGANAKGSKVADARYRREHQKLITELEWRWATPILPEGGAEVDVAGNAPIVKDIDDSGINKKIRSIIIPRIDFEEVTIPTAIRFLQEESRRNDPEGIGVNIFLRRENRLAGQQPQDPNMMDPGMMDPGMMDPGMPPAAMPVATDSDEEGGDELDPEANARRISLIITDRSLYDALRLICAATGYRMRVERYAVVIAPPNVPLDDLETKIFPIERTAFGDTDVENPEALKQHFVDLGVGFPSGSQIVYDTRISRLIATNTIENLRLMDDVIQDILSEKDPMVEIVAKFIEITQDDMKELGFDYSIAYNPDNNPDGQSNRFIPDSASHRLSFQESMSGLNRHYTNDAGASNRMFEINGVMGGENGFAYGVDVYAANRLSASDVLASPRITTISGMTAMIKMVREVYFVDDWEDSESTTQVSTVITGSGNNSALFTSTMVTYISPFPNFDDEPEELGVVFEVTPEVDKARRIIRLTLAPQLKTQVGWTTYSNTDPISGNMEYQEKPIFAERRINTTVSVYDGEPVVLGGVIEENFREQLDKIPILGDLPIIGRLFQNRYEVATKNHLLIFVTCRLVKPDGTPFFPSERINRGIPHFGRLE